MATKKMTQKADDKLDKKQGIKEGSKKDLALDKKRGITEDGKKGGFKPFKKGGGY